MMTSIERFCCAECSKKIDLTSDVEKSRTSALSSMIGSDSRGMQMDTSTSANLTLDQQLNVNATLDDFISGRHAFENPLCENCTDALIDAQQKTLDFQKKQLALLERQLAQLKIRVNEKLRNRGGSDSTDSMFLNHTSDVEGMSSSCQEDRGSSGGDTPTSMEESVRTTTSEKGQQQHEEEGESVKTKVAFLQEELRTAQQKLARYQRDSRLLDIQIAKEMELLKQREAEFDRESAQYNEARVEVQEAEARLLVLEGRFVEARRQFAQLQTTALLNAAFPIAFDGHIGVINGLHLGRLTSKPIPWSEVNAALGQCALLVVCLATKLNHKFENCTIVPMGNQSKITAKPNGTPLPLYYSTGSMRIFSNPSFDSALMLFLDCVGQLQAKVESPPNFTLPYKILDGGRIQDRSGATFAIKFSSNSEENWTKALKMLLLDLKFIVAFASRPLPQTSNTNNHDT